MLEGIYLFLAFGPGVPLMVLSMAASAQKDRFIHQLRSKHRQINLFAGIVLIGIGVYDLILISQFLGILTS